MDACLPSILCRRLSSGVRRCGLRAPTSHDRWELAAPVADVGLHAEGSSMYSAWGSSPRSAKTSASPWSMWRHRLAGAGARPVAEGIGHPP
eukprot:57283-Pyramimonas_sp.AAC.1